MWFGCMDGIVGGKRKVPLRPSEAGVREWAFSMGDGAWAVGPPEQPEQLTSQDRRLLLELCVPRDVRDVVAAAGVVGDGSRTM